MILNSYSLQFKFYKSILVEVKATQKLVWIRI